MSNMEKETVDTLVKPDQGFAEELKLAGSSNDMNQNQFRGGDEVDLLGDGVPGYETTGEEDTDDEIAQQQLSNTPTP